MSIYKTSLTYDDMRPTRMLKWAGCSYINGWIKSIWKKFSQHFIKENENYAELIYNAAEIFKQE